MASRGGTAERLLTAAQFAELPEDDRYDVELVRGHVVREPVPANFHGALQLRLGARVLEFVERHGLGVVMTHAGFETTHAPDSVRGPDIAFVARARVQSYDTTFWRGAPDLAVELLSPSNRASDMQEKVLEYLAAGSRLVWVIDPRRRTATVYRNTQDIRILGESDTLEGGDVLPGFQLALADLFR